MLIDATFQRLICCLLLAGSGLLTTSVFFLLVMCGSATLTLAGVTERMHYPGTLLLTGVFATAWLSLWAGSRITCGEAVPRSASADAPPCQSLAASPAHS